MSWQLGSNHGSGAVASDPMDPAMAAAAATRFASPLGDGLDGTAEAARTASPLGDGIDGMAVNTVQDTRDTTEPSISEDSFGLTHPKPPGTRRARHRSGSGLRVRQHQMTTRAASTSNKRGLPRLPSPTLGKKISAASPKLVQASDETSGARITALEQQRNSDHMYIGDLVSAIRQMQVMMEHQQERISQHDKELKEQTHLGLQLRREVFAVRDRIPIGVNLMANATEQSMDHNITSIIEAKFGQLDALVAQLQSSVAHLGDREGKVEQVVQAQHEDKPKEEQIITGAFVHMDQRISQVSELVRKFDGCQIPIYLNAART